MLFKNIPEPEVQKLLSKHNIKESYFNKGEILAFQGEPCNRLIILLKGSVRGEMSDPSGKVFKVEDISAPSPLAILFLFGKDNRFPVEITANEETKTLVIPQKAILGMLGENPVFLKNYLDISADFAGMLSQRLHFMSFRTIRQKIGIYLMELSEKANSIEFQLDKSKTALASFFGVSRPALEREFTRLQEDGFIRVEKKTVVILNKKGLGKWENEK